MLCYAHALWEIFRDFVAAVAVVCVFFFFFFLELDLFNVEQILVYIDG